MRRIKKEETKLFSSFVVAECALPNVKVASSVFTLLRKLIYNMCSKTQHFSTGAVVL